MKSFCLQSKLTHVQCLDNLYWWGRTNTGNFKVIFLPIQPKATTLIVAIRAHLQQLIKMQTQHRNQGKNALNSWVNPKTDQISELGKTELLVLYWMGPSALSFRQLLQKQNAVPLSFVLFLVQSEVLKGLAFARGPQVGVWIVTWRAKKVRAHLCCRSTAHPWLISRPWHQLFPPE